MEKTLPRGVYGVVLTTFDEQGRLDEAALLQELDHCLATRTTGLVMCGSTGEFVYMAPETYKRVLELGHKAAGGSRLMVGGASAPNEGQALDYLNAMAGWGYEYALVCPPYYNPQTAADIEDFYLHLAARAPAGIKLLLYNIPSCAPGIPAAILPRLMQQPNIVGMKDSSGDLPYFVQAADLARLHRPEFSLLTGQDPGILPSLTVGAVGCMTCGGVVLNHLCAGIIEAFDAGRMDEAADLQLRLARMMRHAATITFPENYRAIARVAGIPCGAPQRHFRSLQPQALAGWNAEMARLLQG